jgi:hypothetical protein
MYSEKFLRSLGLEEWIGQQEPQNSQQETLIPKTTEPERVIAEPPEQSLPSPTCWNCINLLENCCLLDDTLIIENPKETTCDFFERKRCSACEDYQDGFCCFHDDLKKPKNPGGACEYDF